MWVEITLGGLVAGALYRLLKLTHLVNKQTDKLEALGGSPAGSEDPDESPDEEELNEQILEAEYDEAEL